jgi:hypothetical protein
MINIVGSQEYTRILVVFYFHIKLIIDLAKSSYGWWHQLHHKIEKKTLPSNLKKKKFHIVVKLHQKYDLRFAWSKICTNISIKY